MRHLALIGALLLAVPASAQTPTPTATPRPPVSPPCPIPTPEPAATGIPTAAPEATATPTATPLVKTPQILTVAVFLINSPNGTSVLSGGETVTEWAEQLVWTNPIPSGGQECWTSGSSIRADYDLASYGIMDILCNGEECDDIQPENNTYDIFGPYESLYDMDEVVFTCDGNPNGTCNYCWWSDDAKTMAVAAEHLTQEEMDAYDYLLFSLPWRETVPPTINSCAWGGLGQVGGRMNWINTAHSGVIRHEMGHNFGLPTHVQDPTDLTGGGAFGLSAPNLIAMDFMPPSSVEEIENGGRQEFLLLPSAVDPYDFPGLRVVKIVVPETRNPQCTTEGNPWGCCTGEDEGTCDSPYYISFRDDTGMDNCIVDANARMCSAPGVSFDCCTGEESGTCYPEFAVSIHRWGGAKRGIGGPRETLEIIGWLKAGERFYDEDGNFRIEVTNISEAAHWEMEMTVDFSPFLPTGVVAD